MDRFKKVAIKNNIDSVMDDLYKYDEAAGLVNRIDLDLSKVNIYLHQMLHLVSIRTYRLRVFYGNIADDGSF